MPRYVTSASIYLTTRHFGLVLAFLGWEKTICESKLKYLRTIRRALKAYEGVLHRNLCFFMRCATGSSRSLSIIDVHCLVIICLNVENYKKLPRQSVTQGFSIEKCTSCIFTESHIVSNFHYKIVLGRVCAASVTTTALNTLPDHSAVTIQQRVL
jgi:hypothetical protein